MEIIRGEGERERKRKRGAIETKKRIFPPPPLPHGRPRSIVFDCFLETEEEGGWGGGRESPRGVAFFRDVLA